MVQQMPPPDDLSRRRPGGHDLDDVFGLQAHSVQQVRIATGRDGLGARDRLPGEDQHVPTGQRFDVVVLPHDVVVIQIVPQQIAVPVEALDAAAATRGVPGHLRRAQQVTVFEQVGRKTRPVVARPRMHEPALHVDQVGRRVRVGRKQGVAGERPGVVEEQADRLLLCAGRHDERGREQQRRQRGACPVLCPVVETCRADSLQRRHLERPRVPVGVTPC